METEALRRLTQQLRTILIFGGDICADNTQMFSTLNFRSLTGTEKDVSGACPSYERIQAGAVLYQWNPQLIFVVSGGKSNLPDISHFPLISTVMKAELEMLGIHTEKIVEENEAFNTGEQVVNCARLVKRLNLSEQLGILCPFYQFPRVLAIMHVLGKETENMAILQEAYFLSMERILMSDDEKRWGPYFQALYIDLVMRETFAKELLGTGQICTGHSPFFPQSYRNMPDPLALLKIPGKVQSNSENCFLL